MARGAVLTESVADWAKIHDSIKHSSRDFPTIEEHLYQSESAGYIPKLSARAAVVDLREWTERVF